MDSTTYQKIIRHHGWDHCDHDRVRRFCDECKWDVPAYMRQGDPENVRTAVPTEENPAEAN